MRVTRTYLELPGYDALVRGELPHARAELVALPAGAVAEWRALYAHVGTPYHWHDRDAWSDERLRAHLSSPTVRTFRVAATIAGELRERAGFLELERHGDGRVEIVYMGLERHAHGQGLGRWLVVSAVDEARAMQASAVWLHTCTLDGPAALPNYLARGFVPVRTEEYETVITRNPPE